MGREYIWRHCGWWGVIAYGVIVGSGASIHMAGRQYIWRGVNIYAVIGGLWGVHTYGVIEGGGA